MGTIARQLLLYSLNLETFALGVSLWTSSFGCVAWKRSHWNHLLWCPTLEIQDTNRMYWRASDLDFFVWTRCRRESRVESVLSQFFRSERWLRSCRLLSFVWICRFGTFVWNSSPENIRLGCFSQGFQPENVGVET